MEPYPRLVEADARAKTIRAGVTVVAAIETYRRENGAYPQSLDDLAPSVLTQLPADPFTGQPFHYTRKLDSYQLYSAGTNMRDDGGRGDPWIFKHDDYVIANGTNDKQP
jgi:type II secretory pathway pseudopilin PulG